jgi:hypothetical protein
MQSPQARYGRGFGPKFYLQKLLFDVINFSSRPMRLIIHSYSLEQLA